MQWSDPTAVHLVLEKFAIKYTAVIFFGCIWVTKYTVAFFWVRCRPKNYAIRRRIIFGSEIRGHLYNGRIRPLYNLYQKKIFFLCIPPLHNLFGRRRPDSFFCMERPAKNYTQGP